jgi:hypothetical protein
VLLGDDGLRVRVGLLWDAVIPYAAVAEVADAPRPPLDRRTPGYLHAAFAGTPQTLLTLAEPMDVAGMYGMRRKGVRRIALYVDEPAAFRAALRARLHR